MSVLARLGFDSDATVAVVHADDIGMSHAANVGSFETLTDGSVTCGSLMVPCPWFAEAAAWAHELPDIDLGVHATLNAEYDGYRWGPVAGRTAVPSLVDDAGNLFRTSREVVERASVDDVETELRAQIDAALAAGIDVTHLDSHMGTVLHAKFVDVYLRLANEYRLPVFLPRRVNGFEHDERVSAWAAEVAARAESSGQVVFDGYCADSLGFEHGTGPEHNRRRIEALEPGLNYLICHPAFGGEELAAITDTDHQRDAERRFYAGEASRAALTEAGVETIGMRALRELIRS